MVLLTPAGWVVCGLVLLAVVYGLAILLPMFHISRDGTPHGRRSPAYRPLLIHKAATRRPWADHDNDDDGNNNTRLLLLLPRTSAPEQLRRRGSFVF